MANSEWLLDSITQDVVSFISEDSGISYNQALDKFYTSKTYENLNKEKDNADFEIESAEKVYKLYLDELTQSASA